MRISDWSSDVCSSDLLEMLNILENFDLFEMGHNSADYIVTVAEAMKRATVDKDAHVGDPDFFDVPIERLTSKEYGESMATLIRRGERVHVPRLGPEEPKDTTHISVMDGDGNAVSVTHSLGMPRSEEPTSELQSLMRNQYA